LLQTGREDWEQPGQPGLACDAGGAVTQCVGVVGECGEGARYRSKLPISTSRAEGYVDEIANARMAREQRMRRSPQGAHRVATVRAAVLDRLFGSTELALAA
jgi:hypothetical protein